MRLSNKIVLASTSNDKLREMRALFERYPEVEIVSAKGIIANPEKLAFAEIHDNYTDNATAKARLANQACHYVCLADDTGLEVDALEGRPGVHSHRFAKLTPGSPHSNLEQHDANRRLLLEELKKRPDAPRTARFVTVLALSIEGLLVHARGTLEGSIAEEASGGNGFGYDSLFIPQGRKLTLAELSEQEKNAISHRAMAVRALMEKLKDLGVVFVKP